MRLVRALFPIVLLGLSAAEAPAQVVSRFREDRTGAGEAALALARQALDAYCLRRERLTVPEGLPPLLYEHAGVFVSSQMDGAPRCCMGTLRPRGSSLAGDIIHAATLAAAHDLRFPPIKPEELPRLQVIVSILDPPQAVRDPYALDPLEDGLAVRSALRTGVVLPAETRVLERFVSWALIRAGAGTDEQVEYFRLKAARYVEGR